MTDYQFQFGSFQFGAGTPHAIIGVDGIEGLPDIRNQDDNKGFNDGMFSGRDFYGSRTITFGINTFGGNGNSASQNFELLKAALNPQQQGTTPLSFQLSPTDSSKTISGRVRARSVTIDPEYTFGLIRSVVTIVCPDPRFYDLTWTELNLSPQVVSGRTYDRTYDLVYGGGSLTSTGTATNNGWANSEPIVTITGPITNATVGNATTGEYLQLNYTLAASDTVVLDCNAKTVVLNGSSARNILANNSDWFSLAPGSSQIYFTGSSFTPGTTTATVAYRSAFV